VLYLAYADSLTNLDTTNNTILNQSDAVGFSLTPFNASGIIKQWRGYLFSKSMYASGDPTDYIWEDVTAVSASVSYVREYSTDAKLQTYMGDPDNPGTGITWTPIATGSPVPSSAFWVAEKYTFNDVTSSWVLFPVKSREVGTPLASYTITGRNKPALSSSQWNDDTLVAMGSHTGETYSSVKEFGYGTAVVIKYDDGKQYGLYKKNSSGVGEWVAPADFIDGDLLVDGTINADKLMANSIQAGHITVTGPNAVTPSTISAATQVSMTQAQIDILAAQSTADGKIYTFYQDAEPTSMTVDNDGDFWVDTNAGNDLYRYDWNSSTNTGAWVDIANSDIAQAIIDAAGAQATADGKIRTFYQNLEPSGMVAGDIGDLWIDLDDGNKLYRFSGSVWQVVQDSAITAAQETADAAQTASEVANAIANDQTVIDGARITTGTVNAARISLSPYQVGAGAQDVSGQTRLVIDGTKISIWEGNVERVRLGAL
jgi:hypothetical protein